MGLLGEVRGGTEFTLRGRGFRASRPCTWVPQASAPSSRRLPDRVVELTAEMLPS